MVSFLSCSVFLDSISLGTLCPCSSDSDKPMETSAALLEAEETSSAIRALGPLFKLTEAHLWNDDGSMEGRGWILSKLKPIHKHDFDSSNSFTSKAFLPLPEDLELARQMNDMGLPVSFQTNKEKKISSGGKRKAPKKKNFYHHEEIDNSMISSVRENEEVCVSAATLNGSESSTLCSISLLGIGEQVYSDLKSETNTRANEISSLVLHYDLDYDAALSKDLPKKDLDTEADQRLGDECSSGSCLVDDSVVNGGKGLDEIQSAYAYIDASVMSENGVGGEIFCNDVNVELMHESEAVAVVADLHCLELVKSDTADSSNGDVSGDWRVYWDEYYMRNYFHNIITKESRWEPPPGMHDILLTDAANVPAEPRFETQESIASFPVTGESDELGNSCVVDPNIDLTNEFEDDKGLSNLSFTASSEGCFNHGKKKKKIRSLKLYGRYSSTKEAILEGISPSISKYWSQRYQLFSRFDEGIQMDEEGWFSVTPEPIARHHASRCAGGTVVDCFTGVGGNAIQFAQRCQHVIAIDIDAKRIDYAQHNAAVYGVKDLIDFVIGNCLLVAPALKADTVFLSPPWGGPDYSKVKVFDINVMLRPCDGHFLFQFAKEIAPKVVMFLPRNVNVNQLAELALSASPPWSLEVEKNYLNGKLKAITAYFCEQTA